MQVSRRSGIRRNARAIVFGRLEGTAPRAPSPPLRAGLARMTVGGAASTLYLPLEGGGRLPSRSEGGRVRVTAAQWTQCLLLQTQFLLLHPRLGSLRSRVDLSQLCAGA